MSSRKRSRDDTQLESDIEKSVKDVPADELETVLHSDLGYEKSAFSKQKVTRMRQFATSLCKHLMVAWPQLTTMDEEARDVALSMWQYSPPKGSSVFFEPKQPVDAAMDLDDDSARHGQGSGSAGATSDGKAEKKEQESAETASSSLGRWPKRAGVGKRQPHDYAQDLMLQFGLGLSDAEFELNFGEKHAEKNKYPMVVVAEIEHMIEVLAKAPPAINQKQETRGEFAATAVGKAIRAKKIDVGSEVQQYFDARPDYQRSGQTMLDKLKDALKAARVRKANPAAVGKFRTFKDSTWSLLDAINNADKSTELTSRSMGELSAEDMADMSKKDKTEALGLEAEVRKKKLELLKKQEDAMDTEHKMQNSLLNTAQNILSVFQSGEHHAEGALGGGPAQASAAGAMKVPITSKYPSLVSFLEAVKAKDKLPLLEQADILLGQLPEVSAATLEKAGLPVGTIHRIIKEAAKFSVAE